MNEQCTLAIKNRANLHLARAEQLQREDAPALVPPQHELAYGLYIKSMEQDWQLPVIFPVQHGVLIRLDDMNGPIIGAVGVSGDTSDKDEYSAILGVRAAELLPEPAEPFEAWRDSSL